MFDVFFHTESEQVCLYLVCIKYYCYRLSNYTGLIGKVTKTSEAGDNTTSDFQEGRSAFLVEPDILFPNDSST